MKKNLIELAVSDKYVKLVFDFFRNFIISSSFVGVSVYLISAETESVIFSLMSLGFFLLGIALLFYNLLWIYHKYLPWHKKVAAKSSFSSERAQALLYLAGLTGFVVVTLMLVFSMLAFVFTQFPPNGA